MNILDMLTYKPRFFQSFTLDEVDAAHTWVNRDAPRDECFMSTTGAPYTYGSGRGERTYEPIPFTRTIDLIRRVVSRAAMAGDNEYEVCFSNRYADQHKQLGWHADDSPSIDHSVGIAIVSFGAEREIWFRKQEPRIPGNGETQWTVEKLLLKSGSLCIMPPGFQQTHQHRIPKAGKDVGVRISLTFRKLK